MLDFSILENDQSKLFASHFQPQVNIFVLFFKRNHNCFLTLTTASYHKTNLFFNVTVLDEIDKLCHSSDSSIRSENAALCGSSGCGQMTYFVV